MISSLRALERFSAAKLPDQMLAFGISNKGQISTLQKLFSTHPPLAKRIQQLQETEIIAYTDEQQAS